MAQGEKEPDVVLRIDEDSKEQQLRAPLLDKNNVIQTEFLLIC